MWSALSPQSDPHLQKLVVLRPFRNAELLQCPKMGCSSVAERLHDMRSCPASGHATHLQHRDQSADQGSIIAKMPFKKVSKIWQKNVVCEMDETIGLCTKQMQEGLLGLIHKHALCQALDPSVHPTGCLL